MECFSESRRKGAEEAVNPARSGRAPRSRRRRPGFPNWTKSSSSSRQRKRTRTGGKEERRRNPARSSHPNQRGTGQREVGGWASRERVRGGARRRQRWPRGGRAPAKCSELGGTGEVKRGVGEPNSQMGKSYANSALLRANQCSPSALPRDWLAQEEGGAGATGIPALPIQVHAPLLRLHPRRPPSAHRPPPHAALSSFPAE